MNKEDCLKLLTDPIILFFVLLVAVFSTMIAFIVETNLSIAQILSITAIAVTMITCNITAFHDGGFIDCCFVGMFGYLFV